MGDMRDMPTQEDADEQVSTSEKISGFPEKKKGFFTAKNVFIVLLIIALVFVVWKYVLPAIKSKGGTASASAPVSTPATEQ